MTPQEFLDTYPSPRALRSALEHNVLSTIIPPEIQDLPWSRQCTIGDVLMSVYFTARDVGRLRAAVQDAATRARLERERV